MVSRYQRVSIASRCEHRGFADYYTRCYMRSRLVSRRDQSRTAENCDGYEFAPTSSLFKRHWQLGKLVALNAVEVRGRCDGAFFVTSWFR
jgi:hypothetical protein